MRYWIGGFLIGLLFFGGCLVGREFTRRAVPRFVGNTAADLFVCGRVAGQFTCLDAETYFERLKSKVEAERHKADM